MVFLKFAPLLLVLASDLTAQSHAATASPAHLPDQATLPITFTKTISAVHVKPGDVVLAKTIQDIHLADGRKVASGAVVKGHVVASTAFAYDSTPYAKQKPGALEIQIDSLEVQGQSIPLHVSLRAMASPLATESAEEPRASDLDSLATTTQVGGDLLTPSQNEIRDANGDVVGYNKKSGTFAHLLANARDAVRCDAGGTEQPVSVFSASACGLYGFSQTSLTRFDASRIVLVSTHGTPKIWKHTTALLESKL
ncbi:MAG: hypothetical protein PW792_10070 [Acidobacteriaceae bacterium]|nr:hypothetical protein [Acidobacteriaceae bacterium]